jgi:hypothetical protein
MDNGLDRLEEFIEREENKGNPDWAIVEALSKQGFQKEKVQKVIHKRIEKRKKVKNIVFIGQMILWFVIVMLTTVMGGESMILVAFAFSPILINFLISFMIIKNLYEKFLVFLIPFVSVLIFYVLFIFIKDPAFRNMDIGNIIMINILISLFFNVFVYLTGDFKNVSITDIPKDTAVVEKRVNYVIQDNTYEMERLKQEMMTSIHMQEDIKQDIENLRHDLMKKEVKREPIKEDEIVVATKTGTKFHKIGCIVMKDISKDNVVTFNSKEDARRRGYRPCRVCLSHK